VSGTPRHPESAATRAYRRLLVFYPREFREKHGEEMVRLFRERDEQRGESSHGWSFRLGAAADAVRNGLGERFGGSRGRHLHEDGNRGMDGPRDDLRHAVRALRRSPGFTAITVLTLALGIGANTAIFSVVRAVLLAPLPYDEPEELVLLWGELRNRDVLYFPSSPGDFRDYQQQADLLEDLAAVWTFRQPLTGDGEPVQIDVASVTTNFFDVLGRQPALGRGFSDEDGTLGDPNAAPGTPGFLAPRVILSHGLWRERFGGDPEVLGRTLSVFGAEAEIVGVMGAEFELLMPPHAAVETDIDLWAAARLDYENSPRNNVFMRPIGRLKDGVTLEAAQAQLDRIAASLVEAQPTKATAGYAIRAESLHGDLTAHVRPVLYALLGAVAFVLLIACANVANLLLVRGAARERELAVRAALGGSRTRLLRQLVLESALLSGAGALFGLLLGAAGIGLLLALRPENLPRIDSVRIDGTVLAFTVLAAAISAVIFGTLPAAHASRPDLSGALKERAGAGLAGRRRFRTVLVVSEVALSLVLLIGAGLMLRSFIEIGRVSPGYDAEGVLTFDVALPQARYPDGTDRTAFQEAFKQRLLSIPGVEAVGATFPLPLTNGLMNGRYGLEEALTDPQAFRQAAYRSVVPGYFEAMGTQVLAGRTFSEADNADSALVVVVDAPLAERMWPGGSAVGERLLVRAITPEPEWMQVIGVVEHQRSQSLAADGMETIYFPDHYMGTFGNLTWTVRAGVDPLGLIDQVRAELRAHDASVPMDNMRPMQDYVEEAMGPTRFALTLIGVFAVLAVVLASVGLYGVLAYGVRQRTAEIGVRMAFGAERRTILGLVVGQGLALTGLGVLIGIVASVGLTRTMRPLLVGVTPTDPPTFIAISGIFVLVAALACWIPARRASRVDPVTALRDE
jgi:predicted permease